MAKQAGVITINLTAGTAQLALDLEKAKAKVRDFGSEMKRVGGGATQNFVASSAAVRTLEGNFARNTRAVEHFLGETLKLGPIMQAAFPLVGGLAFLGMVGEIGAKVNQFFKDLREAPTKIRGVFQQANESIRLTDDELKVANDRLENDIAKLEGKHQNTLKVALDEAAASADKLADSLEKDVSGLYKLLNEDKPNLAENLLKGAGDVAKNLKWTDIFNIPAGVERAVQDASGKIGPKELSQYFGGESGYGGLGARVSKIKADNDTAVDTIRSSKTVAPAEKLKAEKAAIVEMNNKLLDEYKSALGYLTLAMNDADTQAQKERIAGATANLQQQIGYAHDQIRNTQLTETKTALEANAENAKLDQPFQNRMEALSTQLAAAKGKMEAAGLPEAAKLIAKAFGDAQKAIDEVNKALQKQHSQLSESEKDLIRSTELDVANTEAAAEWKTKLAETTATIRDRVQAQELLTAAIGKGYEAQQRASVEVQVMGAVGAEHYNDPKWMGEHASDVSGLRTGFNTEAEAKHGEQTASSLDKLGDQIELEKSLAQVQKQGAEAIRLVTLAYKLREMTMQGATNEELKAQVELYNAQRANAAAAGIAKINDEIRAIQARTTVQLQGAEAMRKAELEVKYAEMQRSGATPEEIGATRQKDDLEHQQKITEEALRTGMAYKDHLDDLNQELEALKQIEAQGKGTLETEISLRALELERLQILKEQQLAIGTASGAVKAFFYEMQTDAQNASKVIYDTLTSSVDRVSDQVAKFMTGQNISGGKMLQELGGQMVKSSVEVELKRDLGKLGQILFPSKKRSGEPKAEDNWASNPHHVIVDNQTAGSGGPNYTPVPRVSRPASGGGVGDFFKSLLGAVPFVGGFFGSLFAGGGAALTPSVTSTFTPLAEGGPAFAGMPYLVGERGPEPFFPSTPGTVMDHALAQRVFGGNSGHTFHTTVDARGSDLGVEQRVYRAVRAAHDAAVSNSLRVANERSHRTPQRS